MGQAKAKENPVTGPEAAAKLQMDGTPAWNRLCTKCGAKTQMVAPEVYDEENFECVNETCRAMFRVKTFYGKSGILLGEMFEGMTEGPING